MNIPSLADRLRRLIMPAATEPTPAGKSPLSDDERRYLLELLKNEPFVIVLSKVVSHEAAAADAYTRDCVNFGRNEEAMRSAATAQVFSDFFYVLKKHAEFQPAQKAGE